MIDPEQVAYMENLRLKGFSYRKISDHTGYNYNTVRRRLNEPESKWVRFNNAQLIYLQMLVMEDKQTKFPRVRNEVLKAFKLI